MVPISSWAASAQEELLHLKPEKEKHFKGHTLKVYLTCDSLWAMVQSKNGGGLTFRTAFSPGNHLSLKSGEETEKGFVFSLEAFHASYQVTLAFPDPDQPLMHYTTVLTPKIPLLIPFWPRDILPLNRSGKISNKGKVHAQQVGTRSGLLFASTNSPQGGSFFYFQNLTALGPYCEATKTSSAELVGGQWPEIGFALPVTKDEPLPAGQPFTVSDAFVLFDNTLPKTAEAVTEDFLNHLATIYLYLPKPEPRYQDWPEIAEQGLNDLSNHKGCWTFAGGHPYLNAYVSDYKTPAEIMVQLAVLLPLIEYCGWKEQEHPLITELKNGLPAFYLDELKTIVRWVPAMEDNLDKSEEQKRERVMDSWYLHHPLLNLVRLAIQGDRQARELALKSADFAIKVARHFNYEWPVFYRMDTLQVLKAETQPGKGGEKDVPGAYAHLMLEMFSLTGDKLYLEEAIQAAKKLKGLGFDVFYQANNTSFAAKAMLRLYKKTKDRQYLRLSYACLAAIFKNVQLWDCDYGNGKNFPTFFSVFPLSDAPYTAAYEEQEVYAGLLEYLTEAEGLEILPSVRLLIAEFIKYTVTRIAYYYPALLPAGMLSASVKTEEIDPKLWIPLEDIHDGWEQSGEVGQEVYGAGIAFGIVPRQYIKVPGNDFMIYTDYPVSSLKFSKKRSLTFKTGGDERLNCTLMIISANTTGSYNFTLSTGNRSKTIIKPKNTGSGKIEFSIKGNQQFRLQW